MKDRIIIFCGNYGSGKTEIALNTALKLRSQGARTALVDLDIVNPYFRSSEHEKMLKEHNIRLIAPTFAGTTVDVPALPAEVQTIFADKGERVVIDVGGDDTGATALGRYYPYLKKDSVCVYMVINARRPFSRGVDELMEMYNNIRNKGRINIDYFINNTNMARQTTVEDIYFGKEIIDKLSERTGVPVKYVAGEKTILEQLHGINEAQYPIEIFMRPDWLDETADDRI